jgi:hypothetical protein
MENVNVEAAVIGFLSRELGGVPVYADVPAQRPGSFVTVERVGGQREDLTIDRCMVAVQCWDESRAKAAALAYRVDGLLARLPFEPRVCRVERNSLSNHPDTAGRHARYQLVADVTTA